MSPKILLRTIRNDIDLSRAKVTKILRELFSNVGKFYQTAMESRENYQNWAFINLTSRKKIIVPYNFSPFLFAP